MTRPTASRSRRPRQPAAWLRRNLFRKLASTASSPWWSVVVGAVLYRAVRFVLVTGRWEIIRVNLGC